MTLLSKLRESFGLSSPDYLGELHATIIDYGALQDRAERLNEKLPSGFTPDLTNLPGALQIRDDYIYARIQANIALSEILKHGASAELAQSFTRTVNDFKSRAQTWETFLEHPATGKQKAALPTKDY